MHKYSVFLFLLILGCGKTEKPSPVAFATHTKSFEQLGDSVATTTQSVLVKTLLKRLEDGGPAKAAAFCSVKAMSITDSLATHFKVQVQRISDRNRNPKNKANENDLAVIEQWSKSIQKGDKAQPLLKDEADQYVYYKPIVIGMPTCLQCHGNPEADIKPEVKALLATSYPADQATGYKMGDIRGAWKVSMAKHRGL
ncbi:MAG: DUF3365 domain-containing protein [Bacteroidetes Order II. Incertae sedis bacterium]|nr:DUF3365 domain-containing protein [Bacteroidetes Order II. bacterium]